MELRVSYSFLIEECHDGFVAVLNITFIIVVVEMKYIRSTEPKDVGKKCTIEECQIEDGPTQKVR